MLKDDLDKMILEIETFNIYNRNEEYREAKENWLSFLKDFSTRFDSLTEKEHSTINFIAAMHHLNRFQAQSMKLYSETFSTILDVLNKCKDNIK